MTTTSRNSGSASASKGASPWKSALMWALAVILAVGTVGWFAVSCGAERASTERPVTEEEAQLLAGLRYRNFTDEPVAVRMRFPVAGSDVTVDGYLDWAGPLLYARTPGADGADRLVQAIPGLVATRDDDEAFDSVETPEAGWTPRQMLSGGGGAAETMFDILVSSLFTLTAERDDDAGFLAQRATWREEGIIDGAVVDTFRAPIMVESSDADAASPEALYSLDGDGNIRRFQVNTGGSQLATIDFLREVEFDASNLVPIDLLGGPSIEPTEVDEAMAQTIAEVRHSNWSRSATVEMTVPIGDGQVAQGHGYVDWRTMTAYINIAETDGYRLVLARPQGLASIGADSAELPETLPAEGWETHALADKDIGESFGPIETMIYRLLEMSAEEAEDADRLVEEASQLRVDEAGSGTTHVVEFPVVGDAQAAAGESAFRYHIADERLTEVEMMTFYGVASAELSYEDYPMVSIPWSVSNEIG